MVCPSRQMRKPGPRNHSQESVWRLGSRRKGSGVVSSRPRSPQTCCIPSGLTLGTSLETSIVGSSLIEREIFYSYIPG